MPRDPLTAATTRPVRFATAATALVAVFSPLVLLAFNRDWLMTPEGFLDPWHYVGFFHDYWNPEFGLGAYKVARLPWILSGAIVWRILPPLPAAYVLHLTYLCAMTLATFIGVRRLFGQPALAALVALCLGFYTHAHGSGGWDYHNTAAGTFYMATFAALASRGAAAGRGISMAAAGALLALTVHSNITLVNFLPALALVHLHVAHRAGWRFSPGSVASRAAWTLAGALAITAALALVNGSAGRPVLFFQDLIEKVVRYVGDSSNQEAFRQAPGWYYTAAHLSLPAAVFLAGIAALVWKRRAADPDVRLSLSLILQFLCMAVIWTGWQTAGQTALDWNYFAYALVPSCFVAIAGLLKLAWNEQYERRPLLIALATAAALALTVSGGAERLVRPIEATFASVIMPAAAIAFAVAIAVVFMRPPAAALPAFVIAFALANRLAAPGAASNYSLADQCKTQPAIYAAIVDAAAWLGSIDPSDTRIRTWFDEGERLTLGTDGCSVSVGDIGQSVTSMAFSGLLVEPGSTGEVSNSAIEAVSDSEAILAVITASTRAHEIWDKRLGEAALTRREIASHRVRLGEAAFTIHASAVEQPPPDGVVFGPPVMAIDSRRRDGGGSGDATPAAIAPHARVTRPMTAVTAGQGGTWARLRVETSGALLTCRVMLQNQTLDTLASAPCASGTKYVRLPAPTAAITITLENTGRRPAPVPAQIDVSLASR